MASFRELQKACRMQAEGPETRVAVLGNCATQFFAQAVEGCGKLNGLNLSVYDADYNQMDAQLIDPSSETYAFRPDVILLWMCSEKLYEEFLDMPFGERAGFAEAVTRRIGTCWERIAAHCGAKIIQMNFPEIDDKAAGQLSGKIEVSFIFQIRKLNALLQEAAARNDRVFPADLAAIQNRMGRKAFFDTRMYYHAKMPLSMAALPAAAKAVTDILCSLQGKIRKCVILDLDNTLWGGVIGDDGMGGIEIGELGRGPVFSNLQRWLKQLKDFGIILAVCSKNEEAIAKEPFEQHPEMVLRMSDISVFVANWNDKASNIRLIRETLNIGMDSLVFLDDNPFERNLIREKLPEVTVPELPEDPAEWLDFLQEENLFDTVSFTGEHSDRTKLYQAEFERKQLEQTFESLDDYLESLAMTGHGAPFTPERYPRIAQLTQRSNQFNLRTVRYTESDIRRIAEDSRYRTLYFTLRDRFGDHGLVSVVILEERPGGTLFLDTWLMSCRVLKRGMEEFVVNRMVREAAEHGYARIEAEYIPTPKNGMVKNLCEQTGFTRTGENTFALDVGAFIPLKTMIKEEEAHEPK